MRTEVASACGDLQQASVATSPAYDGREVAQSRGSMDRRQSDRQLINIEVELRAGAEMWVGVIKNLSPSGAFVSEVPALIRGAVVGLAITLEDGRRVTSAARVMYGLDPDRAQRADAMPGIGLRFREPITDEDVRFGEAIAELLAPRSHVPSPSRSHVPSRAVKSTRRLIPPELSSLRVACSAPVEGDRPVFAGSLAGIGVPTLLGIIERARKSGLLVLRQAYSSVTICWVDGRMLDARASDLQESPHDALARILAWTEGTFELTPVTRPSTRVIELPSVTQLLLDQPIEWRIAARG